MSHKTVGVEKLIFGQKVENVIGPSYFTVKLSVYKTTSDMFRTIWAFKTRELVMNVCFAIQRYHYPFYLNISFSFSFSLFSMQQ